MVGELDQHELMVVSEFINSNWDKFVEHASNHDVDEGQAEDLSTKLEQAVGMG